MKYQELINEKYLEIFQNKKPFPVELLINIVSYLDGKVDDFLLNDFVNALLSSDNLFKMTKNSRFINVFSRDFSVHIWNAKMILDTLEMARLDKDELSSLVRYSISGESNIIDNMVRYLVINKSELLHYYSRVDDLEDGEEVKEAMFLGSIPLSACTLTLAENYFPDLRDAIVFDDLLTRDSLRGLKIGERLFKEIFKEMIEKYPDRDLIAFRLMAKNKGGQKFYKRLGAVFFDLNDTAREIDEHALDEYSEGDIGVFFSRDVIKRKALEEIEEVTMEDEIKRVSSK